MHNDARKFLFVFSVGDKTESMQSRKVEAITADTKRYAWREIARKTAKGKSIHLVASIRLKDVPYVMFHDGIIFSLSWGAAHA